MAGLPTSSSTEQLIKTPADRMFANKNRDDSASGDLTPDKEGASVEMTEVKSAAAATAGAGVEADGGKKAAASDLPEGKEKFDDELEELMGTDFKRGLSSDEAKSRLEKFGFNEIAEHKQNKLLKFLLYFWGPIAFLIEAACILAGVIGDWVDFGIILGLLLVNAFIGFIEESRAESALDALKQTLALRSRVVREGELKEIESREIVPGDIIIVRLGDIIPADARLLGVGATGEPANELQIDQSALTGESLPVTKNRGDIVYSSSVVKTGQQLAVVAKTGANTFIGRAANLIAITNEAGHFQKVVNNIGNFLIGITLLLVIILLIILIKVQNLDALEAISQVLVLTIASIPVGLPTVLSVTMAVGAKQLARKNVIVKRLPAVEELAGVTVLCSDKTGTLTLNKLSMTDPYLAPGKTYKDVLLAAYLASEPGANDAIEMAVRQEATTQAADVCGSDMNSAKVPNFVVKAFKPFDPTSKIVEATVERESDGATFKVCKGAPQVVIRMCGGDQAASDSVLDNALRGLRCLGVARTKDNMTDQWELQGLIAFLDPPRPDSAATIKECNNYGVAVKMITGDQQVIAKEVARRLGMHRTILTAEKLNEKDVPEDRLGDRCLHADGFAQVIPEDKFRVVELLQNKGMLIGMTGDGVNDAPALKKANVGIAVHGCTDAARSAADVVLLSPGLSTIVDAVKTSRKIFQRMRSYALYRITSTVHFLIYFFFSISILGFSLPAKLIVMICLLNDAATLVIAVDNAEVSKSPDKWRLGQLITISVVLGALLTASSFAHFFIARDVFGMTLEQVQTVIYLQVSSCPHFLIFGTRVQNYFWTNKPSLIFFIAIVGTQIFAMFISIYGVLSGPIGWGWGVSIMAISTAVFVLLDMVKVFMYRYWSFELTAYLWPAPSRRTKLTQRRARKIQLTRVERNVDKMRNVLRIITVLQSFKTYKPPKYIEVKREAPKGHH